MLQVFSWYPEMTSCGVVVVIVVSLVFQINFVNISSLFNYFGDFKMKLTVWPLKISGTPLKQHCSITLLIDIKFYIRTFGLLSWALRVQNNVVFFVWYQSEKFLHFDWKLRNFSVKMTTWELNHERNIPKISERFHTARLSSSVWLE